MNNLINLPTSKFYGIFLKPRDVFFAFLENGANFIIGELVLIDSIHSTLTIDSKMTWVNFILITYFIAATRERASVVVLFFEKDGLFKLFKVLLKNSYLKLRTCWFKELLCIFIKKKKKVALYYARISEFWKT